MVASEKTIMLIAAYNEEENIGYILRQAAMLKKAGTISEFVVVDDGSKDDTSRTAALGGATVIRVPENRGKGNAVLQGLLHCKNAGAQTVVLADADTVAGVTQVQVIHLLEELEGMPSLPKIMMAVYPQSWKDKRTGDIAVTDEYSGFRAVRMEGLNFLFVPLPDGNGWKFAESFPAKRFIKDAQGYRLEAMLNYRFKKSTRMLARLDSCLETLPFGRGNDNTKRHIRSHIRDCEEKCYMRSYNRLVALTKRRGMQIVQKVAAVF
ncbi:MAG: glycosyltransferase [Candidatus Micrarchaeia archaeon]